MGVNALEFEVDYYVERVSDDPMLEAPLYFDRPEIGDDASGLVLNTSIASDVFRIRPKATQRPWVGRFRQGPEGISNVFATPSPNTVCIVAKGQGYWVPVLAPLQFDVVSSVPIRQVIAANHRKLLLFVDFTTVAAYGANGLVWLTPPLSWDGLSIDEVTEDVIRGWGWDAPAARRVPFTITLQCGSVEGGANPALYGRE